jgi:putative aminopeptidase FrvX
MPRLRKLADCQQAAGVSGKLHLVVRVDFGRESVGVEAGKNSSVASTDGLVACAKSAMADARLAGIAHDNQRYGVAYTVTFAEGSGAATPAAAATVSALAGQASAPGQAAPAHDAIDATVQVAWDVAIVRDVPRTGKIVARLEHGTSVRVGPPKEGWYPIKYGDGFASDGWVYRAAIGK